MNDLLTFPMYITEKMINVVSQESEDDTLERDGGSTSTSLYSGDCRTTPTYVSSFCLFLKCIIYYVHILYVGLKEFSVIVGHVCPHS